ncbi:hypothetical protein BSK59_13425 [Paenibacillus odorifer]|uniref:hypothetical protein n=1 Tax=Paenibacillus odorifer TaxID=189426 RepID=UPI00096C3BE9|nr:hypothetical protein [Paenibacillus odorifer]OME55473.1 hypothetical protein BSK59_13425 [Paenibacillus odorifer]
MYAERLIRILKEKIFELTQPQKENVIGIANLCTENSNNILIPTENNGIRVVNTNDIFYIKQPKKGHVLIETSKEIIDYKSMAFDLLEYVEKRNDSFRFMNSTLIVDVNKISHYNSFYRKIYLKNNSVLDITGRAMDNIVSKELGKELDEYYTFIGKFESQ